MKNNAIKELKKNSKIVEALRTLFGSLSFLAIIGAVGRADYFDMSFKDVFTPTVIVFILANIVLAYVFHIIYKRYDKILLKYR